MDRRSFRPRLRAVASAAVVAGEARERLCDLIVHGPATLAFQPMATAS